MTKKIDDASGERRINWDREVDRGNLVPASGQPGRSVASPGSEHVQGVPLTDAEKESRKVPAAQMLRAIDEAAASGARAIRPSAASTKVGVSAPPGGWPRFGPDGKIAR